MTERLVTLVKKLTRLMLDNGKRKTEDPTVVEQLLIQGYTIDEIEYAIQWLYSVLGVSDDDNVVQVSAPAPKPIRVFTLTEKMKMTREAQSLLLQLYHYDYLDRDAFEEVLHQVTMSPREQLDQADIEEFVNDQIQHEVEIGNGNKPYYENIH